MPPWLKDIPPFVSALVAILALCVAATSLLIAGLALFLNWKNYRRDRHDVEVRLKWNAETVIARGAREAFERFGHITVTNKGRRPVFINFVGLELPGRTRVVNWLDDGVKLGEADASIVVKIPQDRMLEPFIEEWKDMFASASDNIGNAYRSSDGGERPILIPGYTAESQRRLKEIPYP
jgi:hypothetical protein